MSFGNALSGWWEDGRSVLRSIRSRPWSTGITAITLAAGVASAATMATIVRSILLRPLPVVGQDRIVLVSRHPATDTVTYEIPYADLLALQSEARTLEAVAGVASHAPNEAPVRVGNEAYSVRVSGVSADFFRVLGMRPAFGRLFAPDDGRPGAPGNVVIISHSLWQRQFGGDPSIIGKTMDAGAPQTIIGVAPFGFDFPNRTEVWGVFAFTQEQIAHREQSAVFDLVVRLRPGIQMEVARQELQQFTRRQAVLDFRGRVPALRVELTPLVDSVVGGVRRNIVLLGVAVLLILAITLINVAGLQLVQGAGRAKELTIRRALGASTWQLFRQLVVESLAIAALGGLAAAALTWALLEATIKLLPADLPRFEEIRVDPLVFFTAVALALASTVGFGVGPAWFFARSSGKSLVRSSQHSIGEDRRVRRAKNGLATAQLALAVVITIAAVLVSKSFAQLSTVPLGFDQTHLSLIEVSRLVTGVRDLPRHLFVLQQLTDRLTATPGIGGAVPVAVRPYQGRNGWEARYELDRDEMSGAASNHFVMVDAALPESFRVLRIPVLAGRSFNRNDRLGGPLVVIVNRAFAGRAWPRVDPVGHRTRLAGQTSWRMVVGVVANTRYRDLMTAGPCIYYPVAQADSQFWFPPRYVAVRSDLPPRAIRRLVWSFAREVDPLGTVVGTVEPVSSLTEAQRARPRLNFALFATMAMIALVLAAVGVYGVVASMVRQRMTEIAIRMSLGADHFAIRSMVMGQAARLMIAGTTIGIALFAAGGRWLRALLYQVVPLDPWSVALAVMGLALAGFAATYFPVLRAGRVSPSDALKVE